MFSLLYSACIPDGRMSDEGFTIDILPPIVQSARVVDERHIQLIFDEVIHSAAEEVELVPNLTISNVKTEGESLLLIFSENQVIGQDYVLRLGVEDDSGNQLSLLYSFTGWNPHVPTLYINELNPLGTNSRPDCIELYVAGDGNLGGIQLTIGTEDNPKGLFIFPAVEVKKGDYIVVHTKPEGIPEEIDEIDGMDVSGGLLTTPDARDFWMKDAPGLPGSNGAVVLYRQKSGPIIDAVIWSGRTDNQSDEKLGWTRESFEWVRNIGIADAWITSSGDIPLPSDAVQVDGLTATRSLGRISGSSDTNTSTDWFISPTSGLTMGTANSDPVDTKETDNSNLVPAGTSSPKPDIPDTAETTSSETQDTGSNDPGYYDPDAFQLTNPELPEQSAHTDSKSGDTNSEDLSFGNPSSGDTGTGDTGTGDTGSGDTGTGDTGTGNTGSGYTGSGDTGTGDTGIGDTGSIPQMLINELNPEGSGNNPECVEIYVVSSGNIEGMVFTIGTIEKAKAVFIFPSVEVSAGDYLIVHTRYKGTGDEVDETGEINVSGGKLVSDTARDFWIRDASGLPSTNGAVALYTGKGGKIMDAVLWSNRTDDSDNKYLGWTAESFSWALALGKAKAWKSSTDNIPMPSDALAVTDSSATRSLNRRTNQSDSDSAADWYIVPNSGLTFGATNNTEVYLH